MTTQRRIRELLIYLPETGQFMWRVSRGSKAAGQPAGYVDPDGYLSIRVDRKSYAAHRVAWLYMTGDWPHDGFIDHINTLPSDNRWGNLRSATKRLNQENRRQANRNNQAGLLGASPHGKYWRSTISSKGRRHHLGYFDSPEAAHHAYVQAKRKLHIGCTL